MHPQVPWRDLARLRDVLAHRYFGVDVLIVRDVVDQEIGPLAVVLEQIIAGGTSSAT